MLQLLGHLHPVLVHLPIGILLLACLFIWQSKRDKFAHLQPAINIMLLLGMISAFASCLTGFILSRSGDYDEEAVDLHQWMGISVVLVSAAIYYFRRKPVLQQWQLPLALLLVALIFVTGHLGGSLTHGNDYLTRPLESIFRADSNAVFKRKPIANIQEAFVYADVIRPVFQEKCYGCHGPTKQKGKLRLDDSAAIMKGGKDGTVIRPLHSRESELVKRIRLPREDEHHMAPREKPQLTEQEIALITWWIDKGAGFSGRVKDLEQPDKIKSALLAMQTDSGTKKTLADVPETPTGKADEKAVQQLLDAGVSVVPVAQDNHYLSVSFVAAGNLGDKEIALLLPIRQQLVWADLSNTRIGDSAMAILAQCPHLMRLELNHTRITDKGLASLQALRELRSLSLVGTGISAAGLQSLKAAKQLRHLYLYQTDVGQADWMAIKTAFPKTLLDTGGYHVPFMPEDTMIARPPAAKK